MAIELTADAAPPRRTGKLIAALAVLVSIVIGTVLVFRARTAPAQPATGAVVRVARRDVGTTVKSTGVIKPCVGAEVRVGSRISGVVKRLYAKVGDPIEKGQLLAELENRDLVAKRDEAAADVQRLQTGLRYAQIDLQRKRALAARSNIPLRELDLAEREAEVTAQQLAATKAALAYATAQLDYARIVAPIAGVVASVSTQEGETVAASLAAPTFVTMIDLSRLEVWAYVDETDIGRIQNGQKARFTVDTYADQDFEGTITTIYPKAEIRDNVVNYITVVKFDPPRDRVLRPEMTATVRIALALRENVLSLPLRAVRWEGRRAFVLVPRNGAVERRWITTGNRDDSAWEIVDGLREGEAVQRGDATLEGERKP